MFWRFRKLIAALRQAWRASTGLYVSEATLTRLNCVHKSRTAEWWTE